MGQIYVNLFAVMSTDSFFPLLKTHAHETSEICPSFSHLTASDSKMYWFHFRKVLNFHRAYGSFFGKLCSESVQIRGVRRKDKLHFWCLVWPRLRIPIGVLNTWEIIKSFHNDCDNLHAMLYPLEFWDSYRENMWLTCEDSCKLQTVALW